MSQLPQWLQKLRDIEITQRVNMDPRSQPGTILGYDGNTATHQIAGWGQADFDTGWQDLSPDDRVLMYTHFFQFGHLQELIEAFQMLFTGPLPEAPIVVDLGCGPFTGGLAFASALGAAPRFDYIGVDRSKAMRELGERLASAAEHHNRALRIARHWSSAISSVSWRPAPKWRPVFVIVSYLLASPTLNAVTLIEDLEKLLNKLGRGPVTVLYTNSVRPAANLAFPGFRSSLHAAGFWMIADDNGTIEAERSTGTMYDRPLRYGSPKTGVGGIGADSAGPRGAADGEKAARN